MQKSKLILTVLVITTFYSCWHNPGESELIVGNFYVEWNDLESNRAIVEKANKNSTLSSVTLSNYVYAVGHNSKFIIAKQYPNLNDITLTNYFIINLKEREESAQNGVYGPMNMKEFDKKKREFGISELEFDRLFNKESF